jgi:hypothetical protein
MTWRWRWSTNLVANESSVEICREQVVTVSRTKLKLIHRLRFFVVNVSWACREPGGSPALHSPRCQKFLMGSRCAGGPMYGYVREASGEKVKIHQLTGLAVTTINNPKCWQWVQVRCASEYGIVLFTCIMHCSAFGAIMCRISRRMLRFQERQARSSLYVHQKFSHWGSKQVKSITICFRTGKNCLKKKIVQFLKDLELHRLCTIFITGGLIAEKSSRSDWGSNPWPTATLPSTKHQRFITWTPREVMV